MERGQERAPDCQWKSLRPAVGAPGTTDKGRAGPLPPGGTTTHTRQPPTGTLFSAARPRGIRLRSPVRVGRRHPSTLLPGVRSGGARSVPNSPSTLYRLSGSGT